MFLRYIDIFIFILCVYCLRVCTGTTGMPGPRRGQKIVWDSLDWSYSSEPFHVVLCESSQCF